MAADGSSTQRRWLMPLRLPPSPPERLAKLWPLAPAAIGMGATRAEDAATGAHTWVARESGETLLSARLVCHAGGIPGYVVETILARCAPGRWLACLPAGCAACPAPGVLSLCLRQQSL